MNKTMLTDLYQLTMNAAYFDNQKDKETATFDLFIRKLPENWGYFVANGIEDALEIATNIKFEDDEIEYLRLQNIFSEAYLNYLKDFKFSGDIYAVREGTPIAPNTPILRVTGKRSEAQLLESVLLNTINFQTLIASKASRIVNAAYPASIANYGLRRAQGDDASILGSRASYIAGDIGTSNVMAAKIYRIPPKGTMAHSFVMSFDNEIDAFRAYVKTFPENAILLIDTYDTIEGARNTTIVAKELEQKGHRLGAVRLDSGDLCELSKKVRQILDDAGLNYVKIVASNDLNEYKIAELKRNGARIDGYGVGTEMVTAKPESAIPGVYKLVEDNHGGKIKLAEGKKSYPGKKQLFRVSEEDNYSHDILALENEEINGEPLLELAVKAGELVREKENLQTIRQRVLSSVAKLPDEVKKVKATPYRVEISKGLQKLVDELTAKFGGN